GDPEKLSAVRAHLYSPLIFPVPPAWEFRPLDPSGQMSCGGAKITWFPLEQDRKSTRLHSSHVKTSYAAVSSKKGGVQRQRLPETPQSSTAVRPPSRTLFPYTTLFRSGDPEKLSAVRDHLYSPLIFPVPPAWEFRPLDPSGQMSCGGAKITWFPLE